MASTFAITTFGCQMNVHDSERMVEVLRRAGFVEASATEADVVVLNTCSVREKAEQKLRSEIGRLAKDKRTRPDRVIVIAGCVGQQEGEKLLTRMPSVDLVIGPDNIAELPRLLEDVALGAPPAARTVFDLEAPRFLTAASVAGDKPAAFVTIMKGCDERCSFCIVPHTRGPERYRASDEIASEIRALVDAGVREVTLLGQTVNSYRDPSRALPPAPGADASDPDESEFAALLRAIASSVPGLARLRYTSPHPRHLTPSLILAHAELEVLAKHVHMPVQSGSDRVLKRMIRRYSRAEYVERVARLVEGNPRITMSTDVIVGFPGETDDDFEQTLSLVREISFKGLFGFKYSVRPYTPAKKLADDVSEDVKSRRLASLFEVSESILGAHLTSLVGATEKVLFETAASGRTERNEIVHVEDAAAVDFTGAILDVAIVRANKHSLVGEPGDEARRAFTKRESPKLARRSLPMLGERA